MKYLLLSAAAFAMAATAAHADETVPVGHFRSIELRGGGHVMLHQGDQRVTLVKGSTQYTSFRIEDGDKLVIDACNNSCPTGNYDLEIDIATPKIDGVAVAGGGEIDGRGDLQGTRLNAAVNGGGQIDMRAVRAVDVNAAVNGGGRVRVFAEASLHAAVSGGGLVEYWGHPETTTAISGGGDVRAGQ